MRFYIRKVYFINSNDVEIEYITPTCTVHCAGFSSPVIVMLRRNPLHIHAYVFCEQQMERLRFALEILR